MRLSKLIAGGILLFAVASGLAVTVKSGIWPHSIQVVDRVNADLHVVWTNTAPYNYDFFIVRWDLNGKNVGQQDVRNGPREGGHFLIPLFAEGTYSIVIEGCDNGTFSATCRQGWTTPLRIQVAGEPLQGNRPPGNPNDCAQNPGKIGCSFPPSPQPPNPPPIPWPNPPPPPPPPVYPGAIGFNGKCLQGFVWREATRDDHACVVPGTRQASAEENALASSRTKPDGYCLQGFVWREAVANDHVCVSPESRTRARNDNDQAGSRVVR